jgi:hypothetical protein
LTVFIDKSESKSWSKLENQDPLSQLRSKFWGKKIENDAKKWRNLQPTVKDDPANDIGQGSYGLDLGIDISGSQLWVRQDYIRIYDFCSKRHEKSLSSKVKRAHSVVITGQPGIGVFLSSVVSCALFNNPCVKR